jgi:hypothetical protein
VFLEHCASAQRNNISPKITLAYNSICEPGSSVRLRAGRPGDRGLIPGRGEWTFPVTSVSRPALGSTQPPVQWVPGVLSPGLKRGRGVTLTTHTHLVPRSRMSMSYTPLTPSASVACSGTALAFITLYAKDVSGLQLYKNIYFPVILGEK